MLRPTALVALFSFLSVASAQISDTFSEGWDQTKWPIYAPDCNQGGSVTLDTTKGHSGPNSIKVSGGSSGYCGHIFFGTTQIPSGGTVWVRAWIQAETALSSNHATFIAMPDKSQGTDEALRMGGQNSVLMYNRQSDDATLPDMSPQGVATSAALPTLTWQCLEYVVSSNGTIATWLNGEAIAGLAVGPGITNANANGWGTSYKPDIQGVYFGWESYSGFPNTFWYTDISIQASRVGCAVTGTGASTGGATGASPSSPSSPPPPASSSESVESSQAPSATSSAAASSPTGPTQTLYGQCGGVGYSGPTVCAAPATCVSSSPYYSQCLD